ncbi:phosphoserine phosphatase, variant 2 [Balamuthia mandrillaris]
MDAAGNVWWCNLSGSSFGPSANYTPLSSAVAFLFGKASSAPNSGSIVQFIELLQRQGKHVYLISGGFKQMILPLAQALGLPPDNVFANVLLFDEETGDYKGFDESQPTSESGGKARVVAMLKDLHANKDNDAVSPPSIVMIGDGVTDMEARPPADLFVGFGGNVVREKVKQGADLFVMQFAELMALYQEEL